MPRRQHQRWPREGLRLHDVRLEGEDFSGHRLDDLSIASVTKSSHLVRCDFRGAKITSSSLGGGMLPTRYTECIFDGTRLQDTMTGRATFHSCSFLNVRITNMFCTEAEFIDCHFSGRLEKIVFHASIGDIDEDLHRTKNEYCGNNFLATRMHDVDFRGGIDLSLQELPGPPDYMTLWNAGPILHKARQEIMDWPDDKDRKEALLLVKVSQHTILHGQRDLFIEKRLLTERRRRAGERLYALLSALQELDTAGE